MKEFFKHEDFADLSEQGDAYELSDRANEILNKLIESWPVVYKQENDPWWRPFGFSNQNTHVGYVAFIEEILKPKETI